MSRLEGKRVFITGAAAGIGRAAAVLFAANGARVAVADIDRDGGEGTVDLVKAVGEEAVYLETDVTKRESVVAALDAAAGALGGLDVLYNNAGGSTPSDDIVTDAPEDEFWRAISLDLFGTFLVCKYGIPKLIAAGGGAVINTASNVALMAVPGRDCYTAAKGGVAALTRSMAAEYAPHKIRVNAVAPAATMTERVSQMMADQPLLRSQVSDYLLGPCDPIDIAQMALYLASDESPHTTGQIFAVDSGVTIS